MLDKDTERERWRGQREKERKSQDQSVTGKGGKVSYISGGGSGSGKPTMVLIYFSRRRTSHYEIRIQSVHTALHIVQKSQLKFSAPLLKINNKYLPSCVIKIFHW